MLRDIVCLIFIVPVNVVIAPLELQSPTSELTASDRSAIDVDCATIGCRVVGLIAAYARG